MSRFYIFTIIIGFFLFRIDPIQAQPAEISNEAQFSLITIFPGDLPEELFGHSAIRLWDPQQNLDISFNYGTFEFDSFFLARFIYGELDYFLSIENFPRTIEIYRSRQRPIIEQVLNLTADQKQVLYQFLINNAREENRYYRYDFLFDNCSTRIRDVLETVLGDDVQFVPEPDPGLTFRELIDLYVNHRPVIDLGIDLLLGSNIDRAAEPWEVMFLPDFLLEAFDYATIRIDGEVHPLVNTKQTILYIDDYEIGKSLPLAQIFFWVIFAAGIAGTWVTYRQKQIFNRWFDIPFYMFSGLIGLLITFLWFISLHNETANNLNLFWAWPIHLLMIPFIFKKSETGIGIALYFLISAISCFILLLGWFFWVQELHPAVIPILLMHILRGGWISVSSMSRNPAYQEAVKKT